MPEVKVITKVTLVVDDKEKREVSETVYPKSETHGHHLINDGVRLLAGFSDAQLDD
ncbi:hypothetical protein HED60_19295 [Planctomycetales bacterium ZRK34]|nr:hypothetical protein HED60_19295 [Planctomycetales bacterium ZRK34]